MNPYLLTSLLFFFVAILGALDASLTNLEILPAAQLDIWLMLTAGIVLLVAGIPPVNQALIFTGGSLVFLAGLAYLLLGIIIGTGLWLGWNDVLQMKAPIEVHIHANRWGFLSLVIAGLILDQYRGFAGRELAWPTSLLPTCGSSRLCSSRPSSFWASKASRLPRWRATRPRHRCCRRRRQ